MTRPTTVDTAALEDAARKILTIAQRIETLFGGVPGATRASAAMTAGYQSQAAMLSLICTQLVTAVRQLVADTGGHAGRLRATKAVYETAEETNRRTVGGIRDRHEAV